MYNKVMALIYFYDTSELDKQQLQEAMQNSGHQCQYISEEISMQNLDPNAEVISPFVTSTITSEIIQNLPNLKLIACRSTGFNNIDLEAAQERGIEVVNVPVYGQSTVAEYAFSLLLALTRKIPQVVETEKTKYRPVEIMGTDLAHKTIGIISTGHIGSKVAKIAMGFEMNVLAYDPHPDQKLIQQGVTYKSLEELLAESDFVSVHSPYLPATHHLLSAERLKMIKPGAILINTSRGEVVDTLALVELLNSGHIGGAGLDTIEGEKLLNYQELIELIDKHHASEEMLWDSIAIAVLEKMPNVILSPHNAYNTIGAINRINQTTADNIIQFGQGSIQNSVLKSE